MSFAKALWPIPTLVLTAAAVCRGANKLGHHQRNLNATDVYAPHAAATLGGGRQMRLARVLRF